MIIILAFLLLVLCFALFCYDMIVMRIRGEAVERGQAHVCDGEWEWKE